MLMVHFCSASWFMPERNQSLPPLISSVTTRGSMDGASGAGWLSNKSWEHAEENRKAGNSQPTREAASDDFICSPSAGQGVLFQCVLHQAIQSFLWPRPHPYNHSTLLSTGAPCSWLAWGGWDFFRLVEGDTVLFLESENLCQINAETIQCYHDNHRCQLV